MLRLVVVDSSAEARSRISRQLTSYLDADIKEMALMPRINIKPLSLQELRFHAAPDICIVGDEIVQHELPVLTDIRKMLPETPILVQLSTGTENLTTLEHIAAHGADDVISDQAGALEFFKKIILLSKKRKKQHSGQVVLVDGAKGGVGVTSVAAGVAEAVAESGKRVVLIDFDFESQDLSRFMQVRPFINEGLQFIFDQNRPVTEEFIAQCLVPVWAENPEFVCMSPCPESEDLYASQAGYARTLISILEVLDETYDTIVVDVGSARGAFLKTLYRVADRVVFVTNNDPASLYPAVQRLSRMRASMSPNGSFVIVENNSSRNGLPRTILERELCLAAAIEETKWFSSNFPASRQAERWPGSGNTLFSCGSEAIRRGLNNLILELKLIEPSRESSRLLSAEGMIHRALQLFSHRTAKVAVRDALIPEQEQGKSETIGLPAHKQLIGLTEPQRPAIAQHSAASFEELMSAPVLVSTARQSGVRTVND